MSDEENASKSGSDEENMEDSNIANAVNMQKTQHWLNPPTKEYYLVNKWFAVVYAGKRKKTLFIAKLLNWFLEEKNGPVDEFPMRCLKTKLDTGKVFRRYVKTSTTR